VLHLLDRTCFAPYVGEMFTVDPDARQSIEVQLVEVRDSAVSDPPYAVTLVFRGTRGSALPLGSQTVAHGELGRFQMVFMPTNVLPGGSPRVRALLQTPVDR